jgi:hypothetical protein
VRDLEHLVSTPSGDFDNEHERKRGEGKSYTCITARERQEPSQPYCSVKKASTELITTPAVK